MSLVSNMTSVYDRIYPISDRLGVPSHCNFTYTDRRTAVTTTVNPRPRVGSPSQTQQGWRNSVVEVNKDDVSVTGISRTYTGLKEGSLCHINGKPYTVLWIDREQTVTYNLLARPERTR